MAAHHVYTVPFSPFSALEMLNNDIFDIFLNDLFGILKNNAYLCNIKLKVKLRTPAATGNSGIRIMKTLDEIINNAPYEKLNGALIERSMELAEKIRQAMRSAEIMEVGDYSIRTVRTRSGFSDTSLYIEAEKSGDWYDEPEYHSLEQDTSGYYANDFNCWIEAANGRERLKFLNDAASILEEIDAIKQKRMEDVEKALKAVENI